MIDWSEIKKMTEKIESEFEVSRERNQKLFQEFLEGPQTVYRKINQEIFEYTLSNLCLKYNIEEKDLYKIIENQISNRCFALDEQKPFGGYVEFHYYHLDKDVLYRQLKKELEIGIEAMIIQLNSKKNYLDKISKELEK